MDLDDDEPMAPEEEEEEDEPTANLKDDDEEEHQSDIEHQKEDHRRVKVRVVVRWYHLISFNI